MVTIEEVIETAKKFGFKTRDFMKEDFEDYGTIAFEEAEDGFVTVWGHVKSSRKHENGIVEPAELKVDINWSACGNQDIETSVKFLNNFNNAVGLAKMLNEVEVE